MLFNFNLTPIIATPIIEEKLYGSRYSSTEVSIVRTPDIYHNIWMAVEELGHPLLLTYQPSQKDINRSKAIIHHIVEDNKPVFARKKNGINQSYDEYPFACTAEGGTDSRVAAVTAQEQNVQGGQISALIRHNRMQSGDQFLVVLVPDPF